MTRGAPLETEIFLFHRTASVPEEMVRESWFLEP